MGSGWEPQNKMNEKWKIAKREKICVSGHFNEF